MKFDHTLLPAAYQNVRKRATSIGSIYIVSGPKGDRAELTFLGKKLGGWRFIVDNFPQQRQVYTSSLPVPTFEQFENDLARIGIDLIPDDKVILKEKGESFEDLRTFIEDRLTIEEFRILIEDFYNLRKGK